MSYRISLCAAACLIALLLTCPVSAADGVVEINQACAVNTGCLPGDPPGFPVTISSRGSYVLTSPLSVASNTVDGINVTASGVTIDLNGFEIAGPFACVGNGATLVCSDAAAGFSAIDAGFSDRIEVHSGRLRGFPDKGLDADEHVRVHDLVVSENGLGGIELGDFGAIRDSTASRNGGVGVFSGSSCALEGVIANENLGNGIDVNNGCTVRGVSSWFNGGDGIQLSFGGVLDESSAYINGGDGAEVRGGTLVRASAFYRNGSSTDFQIRGVGIPNPTFRESVLNAVAGQAGFTTLMRNGGDNTCDSGACPP